VGEHWGRIELDRPKGAWMINDLTLIRSFYSTLPEFEENQTMIIKGAPCVKTSGPQHDPWHSS
jgi:hypothetical protein